MSELYAPIVDGTIQEAVPGTFGAALPTEWLPKPSNYADDADTLNYIHTNIVPIIYQERSDRRTLNDEWNKIRRMEMLQHDDGQKYKGRSNAYVPVFNRNSATLVASLSRGLFPSDEYLDVTDRGQGITEDSKAVKTYLMWEFERVAQLRRVMKPFLKQLVNYGNSVLKFKYYKQTQYQGRPKRGPGYTAGAFQPVVQYDGLQVSARNMFNFYVYPNSAESLRECTLVFEDINVSRAFIEAQIAAKIWKNGDEALWAPRPAEMDADQEEAAHARNEVTPRGRNNQSPLGDIRAVTECYTFMPLPKGAYVEGEEKGCLVPVLIILAGRTPVYVDRNPFWHQQPPYLVARTNTEPGMFYGYGFGRTVRDLQYLTNDFANQMNDVGVYTLNPITKVMPGALAGPLPPLRPGVVIPVTDTNAIEFDRPPTELVQHGSMLMSIWSGMAQDYGGAPPILQGQAAGKTAKTATGAQILQRNAMMPLQDVVEDVELDVLIPLMYGTWINAQQYRDQAVIARVAGRPLTIDPKELNLDPDFRWLASSQAANAQVRAQQAISLIQSIMPIVPLVMQQGYVIDPVPLIQRIYNDGFGFRGFDAFIHKMNPQEKMAAMQQMGAVQPAGNPGMPQAEQGDRIRSALEQVGGGGEMVPGEGQDFNEMRQGADEMAGQYGPQGQGGGLF